MRAGSASERRQQASKRSNTEADPNQCLIGEEPLADGEASDSGHRSACRRTVLAPARMEVSEGGSNCGKPLTEMWHTSTGILREGQAASSQ